MTIQKRLLTAVPQFVSKFYCGSTIISIAPSIVFMIYCWSLSDTYMSNLINPCGTRRMSKRRWWLKTFLSSILCWSGCECWTNGFLRGLNTYTLPTLMMVNNCLNDGYNMDEKTIQLMEVPCKILASCFVVIMMHFWYDNTLRKYEEEIIRIRNARIMRANNWHRVMPRRPQNELGDTGYLLLRNTSRAMHRSLPITLDDTTTRLKQTQSSPWPAEKNQIKIKVPTRSKSI